MGPYRSNKDIIIQALKDPTHIRIVLPWIPDDMKKDKDVEKALDIKDPRYFSEKYNNDEKLILDASKYDRDAIRFASNELKNDKNFVIKYIKKIKYGCRDIIKYLSPKLQKDRDLYLLHLNEAMVYKRTHTQRVKKILGNVEAEYYDLLSKYT